MRARDSRDRRYPERLAGSYVVSIILHVLAALLLFTLASTSSQEGASDVIQGAQTVTIEQRAPITQQTSQQAVPAPVVPQIAHVAIVPPNPHAPVQPQLHHAPVARAASQRVRPQHRELAKITPTGSPQPAPVPRASVVPVPVPTQAAIEFSPKPEVPAVPTSQPTAAPVAVAVQPPPTATPPTASPSPVPTETPKPVPTQRPATPRPVVETPRPAPSPTPAPTATPRPPEPTTSPRPTASPRPLAASPLPSPTRAPATPAPKATIAVAAAPAAKATGVPSPGPTKGPTITASGAKPSPGPKGSSSPGPKAGSSSANRPGPAHPIRVEPSSNNGKNPNAGNKTNGADLNTKLRALIPGGSVSPTSKQYAQSYLGLHKELEPTPPPDVLAQTKYLYESEDTSGSSERKVKMWVTSIKRIGPLIFCTGWLARFPAPPPQPGSGGSAPNLLQILIGGTPPRSVLSTGSAGQDPVIEPHVTYVCPSHSLQPFTPPPPEEK